MQINKQIYKSTNKDIHERIYRFIICVLNLLKELPKTQENIIFSEQTIRAVTSMGSNDQEADATESKKDFISKYSIVKKENKETNYWLRLISDRNQNFQKRMENLRKEGQEILLVVSKIVLNTKNK